MKDPRSKSPPVAPPKPGLVERVRTAFQGVPGVEEKRMFGSTAFLVRGRLCVGARAGRIMCRIDPAGHDAALRRPGCTAVVMKGRELRGYVHVAATALSTSRALRYWIDLALRHNQSL
jgi:TfoX/Sxy family transcriptional regulator of competence genes